MSSIILSSCHLSILLLFLFLCFNQPLIHLNFSLLALLYFRGVYEKKSNVENFQTEFSYFISSKKSAFRSQAYPLRRNVANQSPSDVPLTSLFCQTAYARFTAHNAGTAVRFSLTTYRREVPVDPSRTSQGFDSFLSATSHTSR